MLEAIWKLKRKGTRAISEIKLLLNFKNFKNVKDLNEKLSVFPASGASSKEFGYLFRKSKQKTCFFSFCPRAPRIAIARRTC